MPAISGSVWRFVEYGLAGYAAASGPAPLLEGRALVAFWAILYVDAGRL